MRHTIISHFQNVDCRFLNKYTGKNVNQIYCPVHAKIVSLIQSTLFKSVVLSMQRFISPITFACKSIGYSFSLVIAVFIYARYISPCLFILLVCRKVYIRQQLFFLLHANPIYTKSFGCNLKSLPQPKQFVVLHILTICHSG
ncbi:hypothetical protein O6H91_16G004100 [Diphasiastrum complanatum]|uniref:Uncharacterized protein n=1 Tax=Diphasiastrum complanatum TaxID=34168 RepID=A0ACC2B9F8_DIPCM|nr:hypothetical protein O6H91_16G004100 [Diphasiastrum complanatum]